MLIITQEITKQEHVPEQDWSWEKNISELNVNEKNLIWG